MKYEIFISYCHQDTDLINNFRDNFKQYGINAWVYAIDRTLTTDVWKEIKSKIEESDLVIFAVSSNTPNAKGQQKELELALNRIKSISGATKIMPIFLTGSAPSDCPEWLKYINGDFLDIGNVKSLALKITRDLFPELLESSTNEAWKYPIPGSWLEVSFLDKIIEEHFNLSDKLYFRSISPIGLFECYSPKIKELFWISPDNVRLFRDPEIEKNLEATVPERYRIKWMIEVQQRGWKSWQDPQN